MDVPIVPDNEVQRLQALRNTNLLNTLPEHRFDRYTRLASKLFAMPVSVVSLVDEKRQWIKSNWGRRLPDTDRDLSLCAHAISHSDPLVINDTRADQRFSGNPLVTGDPSVVFYAGFPVRSKRGHPIGTLSIVDQVPRTLTEADIYHLGVISNLITAEVCNHLPATINPVTGLTNEVGFRQLADYCSLIAKEKDLSQSVTIIKLVHEELSSSSHDNQALIDSLQTLIPSITLIGQLDSLRLIALEMHDHFHHQSQEGVRWLRSDNTEICLKTKSFPLERGQLFSEWSDHIKKTLIH